MMVYSEGGSFNLILKGEKGFCELALTEASEAYPDRSVMGNEVTLCPPKHSEGGKQTPKSK